MIRIIGLGNDPEALSLAAHNEIQRADLVLAKTSLVPAFGYFERYGIPVRTLDGIFEKSRNFETLYQNLGKEVLRLSRECENLCYCVEGSGLDDRSAAYILKKSPSARLYPAAEKGAELLASNPAASYAVWSATDFAGAGYLEIDHGRPLLLREIDSAFLASEVKLRLFESFPEETPVLVALCGKVREIPLFELDRLEKYDATVSLLLRPEPFETRKRFGFSDLVNIVRRLRAPGGCPWDREQTHDSIRMNLLEEACEALEAVELKDSDKMREEMGDLLLQPVFHAVMGEESGEFSTADMLSELCYKLVFRHSHIFGEDKAKGGEEALLVWERNKNVEKNQKTVADEIRDIPKTFPALLYAYKVQKKARKVTDLDDADLAEKRLKAALSALSAPCSDAEELDRLCGDALFALVNVMRLAKAEPELALRHAADRYAKETVEKVEAGR